MGSIREVELEGGKTIERSDQQAAEVCMGAPERPELGERYAVGFINKAAKSLMYAGHDTSSIRIIRRS